MNPVRSKIEVLEQLLRSLTDSAYSVLCESNGLSDNEWKTKEGVLVPEWEIGSFVEAIKTLDKAYTEAKVYFEPEEAELREKWGNACATASFIIDKYKEQLQEGKQHINMINSSLHRNIADAIYGTVKQTSTQRREGIAPETMNDKLDKLVESGQLVEIKPK